MSNHNPVDIGDLCIDCYVKGIKTDTTKEGFVNRIPAETDEYSGYQCGPCVQEDSDYIDKMHEEERQHQRLLNDESWRAGYDVLTEGALGDYPEE